MIWKRRWNWILWSFAQLTSSGFHCQSDISAFDMIESLKCKRIKRLTKTLNWWWKSIRCWIISDAATDAPLLRKQAEDKQNPFGLKKLKRQKIAKPFFYSTEIRSTTKLSAKLQFAELRKQERWMFGSFAKCHSLKLLHFSLLGAISHSKRLQRCAQDGFPFASEPVPWR